MGRRRDWLPQEWDSDSIAQKKAILKMVKAHHYAPIKCSPEYYDWQYRRNPAGEANIMLAVDKKLGHLAGIYAVIPIDLMVKGRQVRSALSLNTLTDVAYRGQGVFTGLAREVYKRCFDLGWEVVVGYPNRNSHGIFIGALGFHDVGDIPLLIKPLKPSSIIRKKIQSIRIRRIAAAISKYALDPMFKFPSRGGSHIQRIERFDASFDEFNEERTQHVPVMVSRHSAYLNWRYIDCPIEYETLAFIQDNKVMGYIAFRVMQFAGMRCGMILDFLVKKDMDGQTVGTELIKTAASKMGAVECDLIGALLLENAHEFRILRKSGFFRCPNRFLPQPFPYIVRETVEGAAGSQLPFNLKNWFLSMGDYDAA
jgi:GNAT superfamily N-acetyltransferase